MVTNAPPVDAAPREARLSRPVPSDWLDIGVVRCPRCTESIPSGVLNPSQPVLLDYVDVRTQKAHDFGHAVADAKLRGEPLLTPLRAVVATNQQAGVKKGSWE